MIQINLKNTTNFETIEDIYSTICDFVLNLRSQNKLTFTVPKELENIKYEEKTEFLAFLDQSYAEFKNISLDLIKEEIKQEPVKTTTTTTKTKEETTQKTKIVKEEEVKTDIGETKKEKIQVEEKEKIKTSTNKSEENKKDVQEEKGIIRHRMNSYLSWILGAGLTGMIGVGLFFMLSRRKN